MLFRYPSLFERPGDFCEGLTKIPLCNRRWRSSGIRKTRAMKDGLWRVSARGTIQGRCRYRSTQWVSGRFWDRRN